MTRKNKMIIAFWLFLILLFSGFLAYILDLNDEDLENRIIGFLTLAFFGSIYLVNHYMKSPGYKAKKAGFVYEDTSLGWQYGESYIGKYYRYGIARVLVKDTTCAIELIEPKAPNNERIFFKDFELIRLWANEFARTGDFYNSYYSQK